MLSDLFYVSHTNWGRNSFCQIYRNIWGVWLLPLEFFSTSFRKLFSSLGVALTEQSYILQDFNVSFLGTVDYSMRVMRVRDTLFLNGSKL